MKESEGHVGIVMREYLGHYFVKVADGKIVDCAISSKLRKSLIYPEADSSSLRHRVIAVKGISTVNPVSIGDEVRFEYADEKTGVIREILPRRSKLLRRASGRRSLGQVIIANVDQVIPVFAVASPEPKLRLLDRFLAIDEAEGIETVICINKIDLDLECRIRETMNLYERIGYRVIFTSALMGDGIEEFQECLQGKISVLIGHSGVGKTSLLNVIQPGLGLRVREISESTGKGQHTTTHLELVELEIGGMVADTPGIREFGLWEIEKEEIAWLFREMRPFLGECRFARCAHISEPGCALKEAVASGAIEQRRYESYLRLRED